ncbi:MAG: hypothetical protein IKA20_03700 [Clostridia bacterium]|nr:hypothetical protein [Clostridia bacterium]
MKDLKRRWEEELNNAVPALSDEVKNAPIVVEETQEEKRSAPWYARLFGTPKRIAAFASACVACAAVAGVGLYFGLRPTGNVTVASGEVISVEINPEAMFNVDKDGKVTSVIAANDDADVVLAGDRAKEMKGKSVEDAVQIFVDYSARLGYLDLSQEDAIRISSCAENGRLSDVDNALESYFQSKGAYVIVVEETVSPEIFCERMGLKRATSLKELLADVASLSETFFAREVDEETDLTVLQAAYNEKISFEQVMPLFKNAMHENLEKLEKSVADLDEIKALNESIKAHDDNPSLFNWDYWTLNSLQDTMHYEYTEAFAAEMSKMAGLLTAYETNYGVAVKSAGDLERAVQACHAMPLQTIREILKNFTLEIFKEHFIGITEILKNVGADLSNLTKLYEIPNNYNEYLSQMKNYAEMQFDNRVEENKAVYEEARAEISTGGYKSFTDEIAKKYGSLSAYFEEKNKK